VGFAVAAGNLWVIDQFARPIDKEFKNAHKGGSPSTHNKHTHRRSGGPEKKKDPEKVGKKN